MSSNTTHDERLGPVTTHIPWTYPPVVNLIQLSALPPAAQDRELKNAVDSFASTGRNVFVHYVTPILARRRELLLSSGVTKKRYPRTAAQLWPGLLSDEVFFWNEVARELRLCLKKGVLGVRDMLADGGRREERDQYVWHAEVAVAMYLGLPLPAEPASSKPLLEEVPGHKTIGQAEKVAVEVSGLSLSDVTNKDVKGGCTPITTAHKSETSPRASAGDLTTASLLDTLPEPFECEPRMMYSHFARYDYDAIPYAVGKHQTAMLRQLADRFDKTGKELFYYYVIPHLCKRSYPPTAGETVTGQAADLWRFLKGPEKRKWVAASARVKKRLGDGNLDGLEVLRLESLDGEVLGLHEMTRVAIAGEK